MASSSSASPSLAASSLSPPPVTSNLDQPRLSVGGSRPAAHEPQAAAGQDPSDPSSSSSSSLNAAAGAKAVVSVPTPPHSPPAALLSSSTAASNRWGSFASPPPPSASSNTTTGSLSQQYHQQPGTDEAATRVGAAAASAAANSFYPSANQYPDSPARRSLIGPSASAAPGTRLARLEESTSSFGAAPAPAYNDLQHSGIGPGGTSSIGLSAGVGIIGPTSGSPSLRGGPKHSISSPTLGLASPHNSLSAILAHGDPHEDEHDWEKDINRQNALGVGHDDYSHENPVLAGLRSRHTHSQSQSAASFADWSPPSSSPVLSGSRSTHFTTGTGNGGHSRSGSTTGNSIDRSLGAPGQQSLHRLIAPFHRDQQASLSQLLLSPPNAAADSRSPGSSSSASASDYFMSTSNNNNSSSNNSNEMPLLATGDPAAHSKMVRRHQSLNHHIGRHFASGRGVGPASATGGKGAQVPNAGFGSSSTVGRSAAAAALRANADPHYPATSNESPPLPPTNSGHSPSMRSPTSPSRYAGNIFRDRSILERGQAPGSPSMAAGDVETFSGNFGDHLGGPSSSQRNRGRGLSDAPNNLMTIHAHLQNLDIHGNSTSPTLGVPTRMGQTLRRDESVDSALTATVRTPTGLMHAPHLASGATSPIPGSGGFDRAGRASRQSASEGMDPVFFGSGPDSSQSKAAGVGEGGNVAADVQPGGNKTRKLPSLITNRDALVRGAMDSGPSVASAAPAGFGYTRTSVSTRPGPGQHGPIGPATAGPVPGNYYESERGATQSTWGGPESPTPLSAGAMEDTYETQHHNYDGVAPARTSSLRQNTFDGATIGSSASMGAKTGSRFDMFRGIKTAAPVATWQQKEIIAGGRDEDGGRAGAAGDDGQGGEMAGDEGAYTSGLGRSSSLHHSHHPGARSKDLTAGAPGLPFTPGDSRTYGARASALQSQWGIALSPVMSAPHHDLYEVLARDSAGGRPARSGSMRVPGSKSRFDDGPPSRLDHASSGFTPQQQGPHSSDSNSPFPGFADPTGSLNNGTPTSPTSAALLEQANHDTMRLSMALAEQQQKTAFLRAQMSMLGGPAMANPGNNGVPGLGMPFAPPGVGNGMGLGVGVGMGFGMGGMGPPGPGMMPGLGPQGPPGLYPEQADMGGMFGRPGMVNGFQPDLNGMGGAGAGAGADASVNANGLNEAGPVGSNILPPLTIPTADNATGNTGAGAASGTIPSAVTPSSAVMMAQVIAAKGYNPPTFPMRPPNARYFVIKSFTEDDVYKCLKYEIWASTDKGNQRLDRAFRENSRAPGEASSDGGGKGTGPGPIFLFFSVNASGHFCGMAQMLTPVDYSTSSNVWAQDGKWKGTFKVRWIFVKDLPNGQLRHIRLTNTPEVKSVTQSRDTQELPREAGEEVLRIMAEYQARTSLLQDMSFYEMQDKRHVYQPGMGPQGPPPTGPLVPPSAGQAPVQQQQLPQQAQQAPPAGQTSSPNPRRRQQPVFNNGPGGGYPTHNYHQPPPHHHHYGPGPGSLYSAGMNQGATQQGQPASAS
ncbi:hypothetical protein CF319_g6803 [Tilletia indica]|nr:hypothetical protein CF319_g6803 [Tilletia indica]